MSHITQTGNGKLRPGGNERPVSIKCPNQQETHCRPRPTHRRRREIRKYNKYEQIYNSMQHNMVVTDESVRRRGPQRQKSSAMLTCGQKAEE